MVQIYYPFGTANSFKAVPGQPTSLSFVLSTVGTNPSNVYDSGLFFIGTYAMLNASIGYPIDQAVIPAGVFAATLPAGTSIMSAYVSNSSSFQASAIANFNITVSLTLAPAAGAHLVINFPPEISIPQLSNAP